MRREKHVERFHKSSRPFCTQKKKDPDGIKMSTQRKIFESSRDNCRRKKIDIKNTESIKACVRFILVVLRYSFEKNKDYFYIHLSTFVGFYILIIICISYSRMFVYDAM